MNEKRHLYYFDYLRFFAMFCVVFMHCAFEGLRIPVSEIGMGWHITNALTSLSFCAVPLFFMISGYLLFSSEKTCDIRYLLTKRLPKLVVPLIAYSALATLVNIYREGNMGIVPFLSAFAIAGTNPVMVHFWFMYTLIGMYLIAPVIYGGITGLSGTGRKYLFSLCTVILITTTVFIVLPNDIQSYVPYKIFYDLGFFGGHIVAFVLGYLLGSMKRRVSNVGLILVALWDLLIIIFMTWRVTLSHGEFTQTYLSQRHGFEVLLAACIFLLAKQNLNRPIKWISETIKPVCALSFPIYLLHNVLLAIWNFAVGKTLFPISPARICLLTLVTVIICYVALKTVATIKPLCYMFTGLSYKSACESANWVYTFRKKSR